jgi:FdhD protein
MSQGSIKSVNIKKVISSGDVVADLATQEDVLAIEEPLEIRMTYGPLDNRITKNISVTMRTPGNDMELACGFLFTEGIIQSFSQIESIAHFNSLLNPENIVVASIKPEVVFDLSKLDRNFYTTSSCGVCGKASINAVKTTGAQHQNTDTDGLKVNSELIHQLPDILRKKQDVFESTGGLHASALFDASGNLMMLREDVGRHNALDKLIGAALESGIVPLSQHILLLSGRASFELIQKAAMAGIQIVAAVGAPSSLAVEMAEDFNITLIGFLRNGRFNIYSGAQRLA